MEETAKCWEGQSSQKARVTLKPDADRVDLQETARQMDLQQTRF